LPEGARYIRRQLGQFRRHLETTILERDGELSVFHAALIQSACRHEGRAQLLTRYLREAGLSLADRLAVLSGIGNATDSRDKCLQRLDLDRRADIDPWKILDMPTHTTAEMATETPPAESDSQEADASENARGADSRTTEG